MAREELERRTCDQCGTTEESGPTTFGPNSDYLDWIELIRPRPACPPQRLDFCGDKCLDTWLRKQQKPAELTETEKVEAILAEELTAYHIRVKGRNLSHAETEEIAETAMCISDRLKEVDDG